MAKMEKYDSLVVFMAPTSQASCEKSRHWGHPNFSVIPKPKEKPPTAYSVCLPSSSHKWILGPLALPEGRLLTVSMLILC